MDTKTTFLLLLLPFGYRSHATIALIFVTDYIRILVNPRLGNYLCISCNINAFMWHYVAHDYRWKNKYY